MRVKREETREETQDLYQRLKFHPVKRPVRFEIIEGPVTLTYPIEVQSTPVTQKQWVEVMGANPSEFARGEDSVVLTFNGKDIELQPDNPVENVTWWSTLVFANRLSEKHGLSPAYDLSDITWDPGTRAKKGTLKPLEGYRAGSEIRIYVKGKNHDPSEGDIYYQTEGYRLPTLAEQLYMLQGERGRVNSFFKNKVEMKKHAWYDENSDGQTHPVGLLQPMMIGGKYFYDLYGNVRERIWDGRGRDNHEVEFRLKWIKRKNPLFPNITNNAEPATRGGSWSSNVQTLVPEYDFHITSNPNSRYDDLGFRLVRTIGRDDGKQGNGE